MKTVHEIPLEKNKCVVALEIGGNSSQSSESIKRQVATSLIITLNKVHPFFGTSPHDSRHETLIASRYDHNYDVYSASEGVFSIDQRKNAEELPCRSVIQDLFLPPISQAELNKAIRRPLIVPFEQCKHGILARVKIWPRGSDPTDKELRETWQAIPYGERLVNIFTPDCFTNRVSIGVFSTNRLQQELPFFIDGPVTSSSTTPQSVGSPLTFRNKRAGRPPTKSEK